MLYTYGDILATEIFDFLATYRYKLGEREKNIKRKRDREKNLFKIYQTKATQEKRW